MNISPVLRSTILVVDVMNTPMDSTEPLPTRTPSTTSDRAPIKQSSSIMTGSACKGSSTPPMPTPPDKCTFLPIWAQLPTVTQVSTMVPSSTKATMLTKLGISTTFLAICDPCRAMRSEEHTSELQSLMRISYAVFCLKKKNKIQYKSKEEQT